MRIRIVRGATAGKSRDQRTKPGKKDRKTVRNRKQSQRKSKRKNRTEQNACLNDVKIHAHQE